MSAELVHFGGFEGESFQYLSGSFSYFVDNILLTFLGSQMYQPLCGVRNLVQNSTHNGFQRLRKNSSIIYCICFNDYLFCPCLSGENIEVMKREITFQRTIIRIVADESWSAGDLLISTRCFGSLIVNVTKHYLPFRLVL